MVRTSYQRLRILSREYFWGKLAEKHIIVKKNLFSFHNFFYNLFWWPVRTIFKIFFRFETESRENLKKLKGPLIIVSNHNCWFDPFLIGSVFPFRAKVFPICFACWWKYFYFPLFFPFVWVFGAFPVKKGVGLEKSLKIPVKILKNKGVVGIFPEGKRNREGKIARGKRGAAYLAIETRTKILPIKIEKDYNNNFTASFLRRRQIKVKVGKVFSLPFKKTNKVEGLNEPTSFIMKKIKEL